MKSQPPKSDWVGELRSHLGLLPNFPEFALAYLVAASSLVSRIQRVYASPYTRHWRQIFGPISPFNLIKLAEFR